MQVLEAPLWGGKASMVLLLPFHVENLARLDKLLTVQLVSKWLEKTNITSISISLPKANISSVLSLQVGGKDLDLLMEVFCEVLRMFNGKNKEQG